MPGRSAILLLPDDTKKTGFSSPLMLQKIMGAPLLRWLTFALEGSQVARFFLLCGDEFLEQALECFPAGAEVTTAKDENPADLLHVFLSTADEQEEDVLVITGPVIYAPTKAMLDPGREPRPAAACMVSRQELMAVLDDDFSLGRFLVEKGDPCSDRDGFFSVGSFTELMDWQPVLSRIHLSRLARSGVEIWDYNNCYVEPGVEVGVGTCLLPGTILQGKTKIGYGCTIGPDAVIRDSTIGNHARIDASRLNGCTVDNNAEIGPYANLRPGTELGAGAKAGAFVELKQATVGEGSQIPHLSYLGDVTLGSEVNIGCGTVTANFDRVDKNRTVVEDNAFIGCNASLVAPVSVGRGAYVAAGSVITEDVPPQALGIARSHQSNRKEWALKNKK